MSRKVYVIGDIDHAAFSRFTKRMAFLENSSHRPIRIILCSNGGDGQVALAFHDRILQSPCTVKVTATGLIASAAVLILAAPLYRTMTRSAWVMVHDDTTIGLENKRVGQARKELDVYRRLEDQWNRLLELRTGTDAATWNKLHSDETYLTAYECLALGLVNEVI